MKTPLWITLSWAWGMSLAQAVPTSWLLPGEGRWSEPAHWSAGLPGVTVETLSIGVPSGATVMVDASAPETTLTVRRVEIGGAGPGTNTLRLEQLGDRPLQMLDSLNVFAGGAVEIVGSRLIVDGRESGGSLSLNDGSLTLVSGEWLVLGGVIRIARTGTATATLQGGRFATESDVLVGDQGGSSGRWILSGGDATVGGILSLADDSGSTGELGVVGGSLTVQGPTLRVGDDGQGRMEVSAGIVTAGDVSVGRGSGSIGDLRLSGGEIRCGDVSVGRFLGATGRLEVAGGTLVMPLDTLFVGREGDGEFNLTGGDVKAAELVIGATESARGVFSMSGGHLAVGLWVADHAGARIQVSGGVLEVETSRIATGVPVVIGDGIRPAVLRLQGGTHHFPNGLVIESGARLEGTGILTGNLTVRGVDARTGGAPALAAPVIGLLPSSEGEWVVTCRTEAAGTYHLESVDDGQWGTWRAVGPGVRGTGGEIRLPVPAGPAARIVRVRVERL